MQGMETVIWIISFFLAVNLIGFAAMGIDKARARKRAWRISEMVLFFIAIIGGSLGSLYRTQDGGKSFREVIYPPAQIYLSDGTLYNPFVMPEEVWMEKDRLYLKVGQGPEGDRYSDELGGRTYGLYASDDGGESFYFVEEALE